jgi:hypothetical protein
MKGYAITAEKGRGLARSKLVGYGSWGLLYALAWSCSQNAIAPEWPGGYVLEGVVMTADGSAVVGASVEIEDFRDCNRQREAIRSVLQADAQGFFQSDADGARPGEHCVDITVVPPEGSDLGSVKMAEIPVASVDSWPPDTFRVNVTLPRQ